MNVRDVILGTYRIYMYIYSMCVKFILSVFLVSVRVTLCFNLTMEYYTCHSWVWPMKESKLT